MKPNELTPFTFPDTGINVLIRKTSPLLLMELRKQFPEPKPPKQTVMINDKPVEEENPSHPAYLAALEAYRLEFEQIMRRVLIRRAVTLKMTADVKAEVQRLKDEFKEDTGHELVGTDEFIYISYIAIGTDEDMEDLIEVITKRSQPTGPAVEAAKDSFPS